MFSERRRIVIAAALATVVLTLACEQLLGLDKFTEVDAYSSCDACDAGVEADAPPLADVFQLPDGLSEASSWARWRMDNPPAEVALGASDASLATFIATDAGTFDNVSGKLLWNTAALGLVQTFAEALAHCAALADGWRLPSRIELVTLLDTTVGKRPFVAPAFRFEGGVGFDIGLYYTSSYARPISNGDLQYWYVDFTSGDVYPFGEGSGGVICVRSN